jgi:cytochrome c-type biogenesis protein CcmH
MSVFLAAGAALLLLTLAWLTRPLWRTPGSKSLLAMLAGFTLIISAAGYAWIGTPQALNAELRTPPPVTVAQVESMVQGLAERLKGRPDDAEGWVMLGRSYAALDRHPEAVPAFQRALALRPRDAGLMADYADALAMASGGKLAGEPSRVIDQALAIEPANPKLLALAGTAAFSRNDFAGALRHWEKLAQLAPDSEYMAQLQSGIDAARQRLAGPAAAAQTPALKASPAAAAAASAVSGEVHLSPALAAKAAPEDTVFIFARAAEGPRMPLAILRKQVKDLPVHFTLDDSLAMSPAAKLSSAARVVVGARISKSGDAMPRAGDLQGLSAPLVPGSPGASGLKIEINQSVVP